MGEISELVINAVTIDMRIDRLLEERNVRIDDGKVNANRELAVASEAIRIACLAESVDAPEVVSGRKRPDNRASR